MLLGQSKKFMRNIRIHLLKILGISFIIFPSVALAAETEEIWFYVFLIPIYFVLATITLLVIFALLMKNFKTRKAATLPAIAAALVMVIGIGVTYYLEPVEKLWPLLLHFSLMGAIVFILPFVQYMLLKKSLNNSSEN